MQFKSIVMTAVSLVLVAGGALAQSSLAQSNPAQSASAQEAKTHKAGPQKIDGTKAEVAKAAAKPEISAQDLKQRLDKGEKIVILDARHHLNGEIIKGAVHVPSEKLSAWAKDVDKKTVIVTYCTCPHDEAAEEEVRELKKMGFENAYSLTGGMSAARKAGIQIIPSAE
jgi:rhodanese-related sulfurtransferase